MKRFVLTFLLPIALAMAARSVYTPPNAPSALLMVVAFIAIGGLIDAVYARKQK